MKAIRGVPPSAFPSSTAVAEPSHGNYLAALSVIRTQLGPRAIAMIDAGEVQPIRQSADGVDLFDFWAIVEAMKPEAAR